MACCGDEEPIQFMFDENGDLQRSDDGGVTWYPAPTYDPRENSVRFPPVAVGEGEDLKCIAANSIVTLMKEQIGDQLTDDMSRYTLGQLISDWINTLLQTSNPFEALIRIATNQIFALVIATIRAAIDDTTYNDLLCIFYDNIGSDGAFTDDQVESTRAQILTDITGVAGLFFEHLVFLLGSVGMSNLARSAAGGDRGCSSCVSTAEVWVTTSPDGTYVQIFPDGDGIYTAVGDWHTSGHVYLNVAFAEDPTGCAIGNKIAIDSATGIDPSAYVLQLRQGDCTSDPLANCYALRQLRSDTDFTITFHLLWSDPCTA